MNNFIVFILIIYALYYTANIIIDSIKKEYIITNEQTFQKISFEDIEQEEIKEVDDNQNTQIEPNDTINLDNITNNLTNVRASTTITKGKSISNFLKDAAKDIKQQKLKGELIHSF